MRLPFLRTRTCDCDHGVVTRPWDQPVRDAVADLLATCPEVSPEWQAEVKLFGAEDAAEIGIYNVIGSVVKPVLRRVLGLPERLGQDRPPASGWATAMLPVSDSETDLARRLYEVLDRWAASTCPELVEAVGVEFAGGWGGWLPEVTLLGPAGPNLRALLPRYTW